MRASSANTLLHGRGHVQHAVDDQRRRFLAALGVEIEVPRELQVADVAALIDLRERAEALLVVGAAVREPIGVVLRGGLDALVVTGAATTAAAGEQRCRRQRAAERVRARAATASGSDVMEAPSEILEESRFVFGLIARRSMPGACRVVDECTTQQCRAHAK